VLIQERCTQTSVGKQEGFLHLFGNSIEIFERRGEKANVQLERVLILSLCKDNYLPQLAIWGVHKSLNT